LAEMASVVVNQYSNVGFYKAPVSKSLLVFVGSSHIATLIPSFSPFFKKIFSDSLSLNSSRTIFQILASKIIFPETRTAVLVLFLIYFFRILERRSGSLKFSSNICLSFLLGVSLELLSSSLLSPPWSPLLTPGPLHLVLPLFVPYWFNIPSKSGPLGPISISSKTISYLVGLQVALTSPSTILTSLVSVLVGTAVHCTRLARLTAPALLGDLSDSLLGWLILSSPPSPHSPTTPMGATLEIQRTQQAEAMEQQLLRARARQFNVPVGGRQMRLEELWNQGGRGDLRQPPAAAVVQPSPVMIQALTDMGFPRQRVEQALIRTNNDLDQATNILLNEY